MLLHIIISLAFKGLLHKRIKSSVLGNFITLLILLTISPPIHSHFFFVLPFWFSYLWLLELLELFYGFFFFLCVFITVFGKNSLVQYSPNSIFNISIILVIPSIKVRFLSVNMVLNIKKRANCLFFPQQSVPVLSINFFSDDISCSYFKMSFCLPLELVLFIVSVFLKYLVILDHLFMFTEESKGLSA